MTSIETDGGFLRVTGTEADLCRLIASRQEVGLKKYGTTVRENPLTLRQWMVHTLEEVCDQAVYLMRAIEQIDKEAMGKVPEQKRSWLEREDEEQLASPAFTGTLTAPQGSIMSQAQSERMIAQEIEAKSMRTGQRVANVWRPYDNREDGK